MKVEKKPIEDFEIVITMTAKEAKTLCSILMKVGGNPCGPRGVQRAISDSLYTLGITANEGIFDKRSSQGLTLTDDYPEGF